MVIFTKKFGTLDPHLPIVWDKVPKKRFFYTFPKLFGMHLFPEYDGDENRLEAEKILKGERWKKHYLLAIFN